jgi:cation diffusion facilitator family transporter
MSKFKVALITLLIAIVLLVLKFYAYQLSGSKAILSDALESIVNVVSAVTLTIVTYISSQPPDEGHPYGHGKIEYISSAFEGGAILFAGILIIVDAGQSLFGTIMLQELRFALGLIAVASFVNGVTGLLLKKAGSTRNSPALKASGSHLLSDFWTSLGILGGLLLAKWTGYLILDPILALIVAVLLCREGIKILVSSGYNLMDAEDRDLLEKLTKIFNKNYRPGIIQIHSTRIIRSGDYHHIDVHITVPEFWDIQEGHDFVAKFEKRIFDDYPYLGELHFHLDPCRKAYCRRCELPNCPIRAEEFLERKEFTTDKITSFDLPLDSHLV